MFDNQACKNVYAFTEHGVAMLSSVLRSPRAVRVNIEIIRAFVRLRQLLKSHADLDRKLAKMEKDMMINSVWFSRRFGSSWFLRMNRSLPQTDRISCEGEKEKYRSQKIAGKKGNLIKPR